MEKSRFKIKIDLEAVLAGPDPVVVELGCGNKAQPLSRDGRIGIDLVDLENVDIVADLEAGLSFLPDASVDKVYARSLFEHIRNFAGLLSEVIRVLKSDAACHLLVPHFSNPYHYSDPTHVRFFGLYSFLYYSYPQKSPFQRQVPTFYTESRLEIISLKLRFRSPFKGRKWWKRLHEKIFNLNPWMQEFYEENLCHLLPCYGIAIEFRPDRTAGAGAD